MTKIRSAPLGMPAGDPAPEVGAVSSVAEEPVTEIRIVPLCMPAGGQPSVPWGAPSPFAGESPGWEVRPSGYLAPQRNLGPPGPLGSIAVAVAVVVVLLDLVLVPAISFLGRPLWTYSYVHMVYEIFRYGGGLGASNPVWWMLLSLIGGLVAGVGSVSAMASRNRIGALLLVVGGLVVAIASSVSKLLSPQLPVGPAVWGAVIGGSAVAVAGASLLVDRRGAGWTLSSISAVAAVGLAIAAFPVLHQSSPPLIDSASSQGTPSPVAGSPGGTNQMSGSIPSAQGSDTTTTYDATPETGGSPGAATVMSDLAGDLSKSADVRPYVQNALNDAQGCNGSLSDDENNIQSAVTARQAILSDLANLDATNVPNGPELVSDLKVAMDDSVNADQAFLGYVQDIASGSISCSTDPTTDGSYRAGLSASTQANQDKATFAQLWDEVAPAYNQQSYQAGDF